MKQFESFALWENLDLVKSRFSGVRSPYEEILYLLHLVSRKNLDLVKSRFLPSGKLSNCFESLDGSKTIAQNNLTNNC